MNRDIVKGKVKQAEGRVRDALGDLTDDPRDDARGKAKVAEGKIQEGIGKTRRAIKKALD
jgi:uncharacterized protein YjbJ (UPF0337 family)